MLAACVYGGWAAYSNSGCGLSEMLVAGSIQGGFAFSSTLLLGNYVNWLKLRRPKQSTFKQGSTFLNIDIKSFIVFLQASLLLAIIPGCLHYMVGTTHIMQAMFPGLIVGNGYIVLLINKK